MKLNMLFLITLRIIITSVSRSCNATILVKFGQVQSHFMGRKEKGSSMADPLVDFELRSRQMLCDVAINAKQFSAQYTKKYYARELVGGVPKINLRGWNSSSTVSKEAINFQRRYSSRSPNSDPLPLAYQKRWTRVGAKNHERDIKSLQCVNTATTKWFLTFGFVDHSMYLLEASHGKKNKYLLVTGLFEPSPLVRSSSALYLHSQFSVNGGQRRMESICRLGAPDVLRLCSAVFDVLNKDDPVQINRLKKERRQCLSRGLKVLGQRYRVNALRCHMVQNEIELEPFYLLADPREWGAVFVFRETEIDELRLRARIIKIAALLHPIGPNEVTLQAIPAAFQALKNTNDRRDGSEKFVVAEEISETSDTTKNMSTEVSGGEDELNAEDGVSELLNEYKKYGKEIKSDEPELFYDDLKHTEGAFIHEEYVGSLELLKGTRQRDVRADEECESSSRKKEALGDGEDVPTVGRKKRSARAKNTTRWQEIIQRINKE